MKRTELIEAEEHINVPVLVRFYGEYWNPELVDWAHSWNLLGRRTASARSADLNMYEQRGVYVLYKDYVPVYVGKAFEQSIGYRLKAHRESRRKGTRWDSFSWFGLNAIKGNDDIKSLKINFSIKAEELVATLEALLIVVIDPKLNARREKLNGAVHLHQSSSNKPKDVDDRLEAIEKSLEKLLARP